MLVCKRCAGQQFIKKGIVAGKQRYKCKECNLHFREGDNRSNNKIIAKKLLSDQGLIDVPTDVFEYWNSNFWHALK